MPDGDDYDDKDQWAVRQCNITQTIRGKGYHLLYGGNVGTIKPGGATGIKDLQTGCGIEDQRHNARVSMKIAWQCRTLHSGVTIISLSKRTLMHSLRRGVLARDTASVLK